MREQNRMTLELSLGWGEEMWQVVEKQGLDVGEDILSREMTQSHTRMWHIHEVQVV